MLLQSRLPLDRVANPAVASDLKPPLKWAGGKRWIVPHLEPIWREHEQRRLVEPFCGGLAVTLGLLPKSALLNDANPHLINFYRQIQIGLEVTIKTENSEDMYYQHRDRFNELIRESQAESIEAAQLFYYLNRTGFNGLCRFNRSGFFNVPFGTYKQINYAKDFYRYQKLFERWTFSSGDFAAIRTSPSDFIYADPPYDVEFTSYSAGGFSWEDQVRTATWLSQHPGPAVLSNQATQRIVNLYEGLGFELRFYDAPRRISCDGNRTAAQEVLAIKHPS
jgi:DNA adenine methylase